LLSFLDHVFRRRSVFQVFCIDCLVLPVSSLQGQLRGKLFSKYGIDLLVLNKRIDFTGKGSPHFGVAWYCYKILPKKKSHGNILFI